MKLSLYTTRIKGSQLTVLTSFQKAEANQPSQLTLPLFPSHGCSRRARRIWRRHSALLLICPGGLSWYCNKNVPQRKLMWGVCRHNNKYNLYFFFFSVFGKQNWGKLMIYTKIFAKIHFKFSLTRSCNSSHTIQYTHSHKRPVTLRQEYQHVHTQNNSVWTTNGLFFELHYTNFVSVDSASSHCPTPCNWHDGSISSWCLETRVQGEINNKLTGDLSEKEERK